MYSNLCDTKGMHTEPGKLDSKLPLAQCNCNESDRHYSDVYQASGKDPDPAHLCRCCFRHGYKATTGVVLTKSLQDCPPLLLLLLVYDNITKQTKLRVPYISDKDSNVGCNPFMIRKTSNPNTKQPTSKQAAIMIPLVMCSLQASNSCLLKEERAIQVCKQMMCNVYGSFQLSFRIKK